MFQNLLKKKSNKILLLTSLAVLLVFALFLNTESIQNKAKQSDFTRTYLEETSRPQEAFEYDGAGIIKSYAGKLYIQDFEERKIVTFDTAGRILNHYYEEIPAGVESIKISWDIDEKGIYMADARRHLITHLGFDNKQIYSYKPGINIIRSGMLQSDQFIVIAPDTLKDYKLSIVKIDVKSNSITALDHPWTDVENSILIFSGIFTRNPSGQIFYVCHKNSQFFCVNDKGEVQYLAQTIDNSPLPKVVRQDHKLTFDPLAPLVNRFSCADKKYLYILSSISTAIDDLSKSSVIDAYHVENGHYAWSLKVENFKGKKIGTMTVTPERFYFTQGGFITYLKKPNMNYL